MEQRLFLHEEENCLPQNANEWDIVNQPITCYLTNLGYKLYRISRAKRHFVDIIHDISKLYSIPPFFEKVFEYEDKIILKKGQKEWIIDSRYWDFFLKKTIALFNDYLKDEQILYLTINYKKVYFFVISNQHIEPLFKQFNDTNSTHVKSSIFQRYELVNLINQSDENSIFENGKIKAEINANDIITIKPVTDTILINSENEISFDLINYSLESEIEKYNLSQFYRFSIEANFIKISRFLLELELILGLQTSTFKLVYFDAEQNKGVLEIDEDFYVFYNKYSQRSQREYFSAIDIEIFKIINDYLDKIGNSKKIYLLENLYLNENTNLKYKLTGSNSSFILLEDIIGKGIYNNLVTYCENFSANDYPKSKIINLRFTLQKPGNNYIKINWETNLYLRNIVNKVDKNIQWKSKFEDFDDLLGRIDIAVYIPHIYNYDREIMLDELLIISKANFYLQYDKIVKKNYDEEKNSLTYKIKFESKYWLIEDISFENLILSFNEILMEIGKNEQFYFFKNEFLLFAKMTLELRFFLKMAQIELKYERDKTTFWAKVYSKYRLRIHSVTNLILKILSSF